MEFPAVREASGQAGRLGVAASRSQVEPLLCGVSGVWLANHNAPHQIVVSGSVEGITAIEGRLAAAGIASRRLDTATAFHSPLVAPAGTALREYLGAAQVHAPRIAVYGNTDAAVYPAAPDAIRDRIATHLAAPVRFVDEIEAMYAAGVRTFVEVGAGATLTALVGKILGDRPHLVVSLDRKGRHGVTALHEALGRLAVAGVGADYEALWVHNGPPVAKQDDAKPRMKAILSGANYGKPYPPVGAAVPAPVPAPMPVPVPVPVAPPITVAPVVVAAPVAVAATCSFPEPVAVQPVSAGADLSGLVLSIVSDKTGYPVDMLNPCMELEADLGIDSIKRVEILEGERRAVPDLPEVDPVELSKLRSLGEVISQLGAVGEIGRASGR